MTLFELIIVMVVVAVLAAVAVSPPMRGMMARQQVEGVHAELLTDLRLARSEAGQRSGTSTSIAVTFGGNADVSCYTIHVDGANCDCTRAPADVCVPAAPGKEIKSTQFARAAGVAVAASSPSGPRIVFAPPQGLATPGDLVIDVQGTLSGHLRTSISRLGVPSVCSPDGSMRGVAPC